MALPAFVPGTIGLLHVQTIGMHPASYLMLAASRVACYHQGAQRFQTLVFQGSAQLQRRARRVTQYHTEGIETDEEIGSLLECHTHALALRIAAVCHGDITRGEGEMLERFAGMDIADQHLEKLQGYQVHRDVQA